MYSIFLSSALLVFITGMKLVWMAACTDCRKCMIWDTKEQDHALFTHIQTLILLRKQHKAFEDMVLFNSSKQMMNIIIFLIRKHMRMKLSFRFKPY